MRCKYIQCKKTPCEFITWPTQIEAGPWSSLLDFNSIIKMSFVASMITFPITRICDIRSSKYCLILFLLITKNAVSLLLHFFRNWVHGLGIYASPWKIDEDLYQFGSFRLFVTFLKTVQVLSGLEDCLCVGRDILPKFSGLDAMIWLTGFLMRSNKALSGYFWTLTGGDYGYLGEVMEEEVVGICLGLDMWGDYKKQFWWCGRRWWCCCCLCFLLIQVLKFECSLLTSNPFHGLNEIIYRSWLKNQLLFRFYFFHQKN